MMNMRHSRNGRQCIALAVMSTVLGISASLWSQQQPPPAQPATRPAGAGGDIRPGLDFGPPGGLPFGPGGMMGATRKLIPTYDKDGDGRLNADERKAAREGIKSGAGGMGRRGPGGFGLPGGFGPPGMRGNREPAKPGAKVSPADVTPAPAAASLYEPSVLRTLFLDFEASDWEAEMADFNNTDVEVPATLTVDGKKYPNVGVHFRGMSSFGMVPATYKRSLDVSLNYVDGKQRLLGYKSLNLLNAHEDASFLHSALFSHIARQYIPAPKVNLVKVVINGENWGVYSNAQQFDKIFVEEWFPSEKKPKTDEKRDKTAEKTKGDKIKVARWKVPGSPAGGGGLTYLGQDIEAYKRRYQIKSDDDEQSWRALVELCRVLNQTPTDKLEAELSKIMDIDGALWFLALDVVFSNGDGYWVRDSDYSILRDAKGKFHIIPHDMNETFSAGGGPGGPGGPGGFGRPGGFDPRNGPPGGGFGPGGAPGGQPGGPPEGPGAPPPGVRNLQVPPGPATQPGRPDGFRPDDRRPEGGRGFGGGRGPGGPGGRGMMGGGGVRLDPLVGLEDASKPLRAKLLAVPALRERYLVKVRTLAETWLDWQKLGPVVAQYRNLIEKEVEADTKKLESFEAFKAATSPEAAPANPAPAGEGQQRGGSRETSLRAFADQRRAYLLGLPAVKDAKE